MRILLARVPCVNEMKERGIELMFDMKIGNEPADILPTVIALATITTIIPGIEGQEVPDPEIMIQNGEGMIGERKEETAGDTMSVVEDTNADRCITIVILGALALLQLWIFH